MTHNGLTHDAVAAIMHLQPDRVRSLVAEEGERVELNSLRCNSIPVERTAAVITAALAHDPDLTIVEIAQWLEMAQADFERAFLGRGRGGGQKMRVNVANASRLMLALGRAPNELEGC